MRKTSRFTFTKRNNERVGFEYSDVPNQSMTLSDKEYPWVFPLWVTVADKDGNRIGGLPFLVLFAENAASDAAGCLSLLDSDADIYNTLWPFFDDEQQPSAAVMGPLQVDGGEIIIIGIPLAGDAL
jgi:hypothetical protein